MEASIVDLRYKSRRILQALARREPVTILYHGKVKGTITAPMTAGGIRANRHPLFGLLKKERGTVEEVMRQLRGGRYRAL